LSAKRLTKLGGEWKR